ncbi:helicase-associated domain-containing protein [Microbacterium dauci]|uniref:Helicase-associated domain-containing protein n=1 Tax=Microbacterium dauci TaxID=3048008 RepID=A0ABT6ZAA7_9MICO|nr:helicase-associated domain-containing protein [Microbacterium sp. LX3-4]MDJ1113094.1 helicase-associated domain-containing protein [Microbacterium sp. LX3-4]
MTATDARTLATHLAQLDTDALAGLFTARQVSPTATWADFFDVAEALLDPTHVTRAVSALSDAELCALRAPDAATPALLASLTALALVDDGGRPFEAVATALDQVSPVEPAVLFDGAPESDEAAAERAFEAAASLADILHSATVSPLGRIGTGALSATDRRRLVEIGAARTGTDADELVAIAVTAGLLVDRERTWLITDDGAEWLRTRTVHRWELVAERLRDALPPALRGMDGGWRAPAEWPGAVPFDASWPERVTRLAAEWRQWALLSADGSSPSWASGLATGGDADIDALQALLPHEVDKVYLQNDLTAISPGPLEPRLDLRLRTMARRESRAQASSYRFTADTIGAALAAGETAASLTEFIGGLSLTGVPQPLAYEIERAAARHGALRVGPNWQGHTRITGDRDLLDALAVDQALRPLGLIPEGDHLLSRTGVDTTFWMLADARYPVLAVDADGNPRALDRHHAGGEGAPAPTPVERYAPLLERLRASTSDDADAAWLERELEHAVRTRSVVVIVVQLPDGSTREVTVEAAGLGGGRLRGRDRAADVERTLPLASIVSVRPA